MEPGDRSLVDRLAQLQGTSAKEAVMEAVRHRLAEVAEEETPFTARPGGPRDGLDDLIGCFDSGLRDLSVNKEYLEGFGEQ